MNHDDIIERVIDRSRAVIQAFVDPNDIGILRDSIVNAGQYQRFKYAYWDLEPEIKRCNDLAGDFNQINYINPDAKIFGTAITTPASSMSVSCERLALHYLNTARLAWVVAVLRPVETDDESGLCMGNNEALTDFENLIWAVQIQAFGPVIDSHVTGAVLSMVRQAQFTLWFCIESISQTDRKNGISEIKMRKFFKRSMLKLSEVFLHSREEGSLFAEDAALDALYNILAQSRDRLSSNPDDNMKTLAALMASLVGDYLAHNKLYPQLCKFVRDQFGVLEHVYARLGEVDSHTPALENDHGTTRHGFSYRAPILQFSSEESLVDEDETLDNEDGMSEASFELGGPTADNSRLFDLPASEQIYQLSRMAGCVI